jgi:hypothetical protein
MTQHSTTGKITPLLLSEIGLFVVCQSLKNEYKRVYNESPEALTYPEPGSYVSALKNLYNNLNWNPIDQK